MNEYEYYQKLMKKEPIDNRGILAIIFDGILDLIGLFIAFTFITLIVITFLALLIAWMYAMYCGFEMFVWLLTGTLF